MIATSMTFDSILWRHVPRKDWQVKFSFTVFTFTTALADVQAILQSHSHPISGLFKNVVNLVLKLMDWVPTIIPSSRQGHGHENRLDSRPGLHQSELCAAIIHQIELHVASPPNLLPLLFLFTEALIAVPPNQRDIRLRPMGGALHHKVVDHFLLSLSVHSLLLLIQRTGQIIKEYAANSPTLIPSMFDDKVVIAPLFEFGIKPGVVFIAAFLERPMEMGAVYRVQHRRREIPSASKPPHFRFERARFRIDIAELKVPIIEVSGGSMRIPRMTH